MSNSANQPQESAKHAPKYKHSSRLPEGLPKGPENVIIKEHKWYRGKDKHKG